MLHKKLFLLWVFLFCCNSYSQNKIFGKISCSEPNSLLRIHVHVGNKISKTDEYGNYSQNNLPNGPIKISIYNTGYQAIDTVVDLKSNLKIDFTLKANTNKLNEVVIQQRNNKNNKSVAEQQLKKEIIEKYSNQSLGDALKEISGISTLKTGNTVVKPIINGLYGSRVPIIYNNVRLEDQQWGTEHAPNFDINAAEKITVIKGSSGLQYGGDAIGGLVIIEPTRVLNDTLFGKTMINLDSNGKGGSISSSFHKSKALGLSWNAVGTLKYMGDRESPHYILSNTANREANFSGDLRYTAQKYNATAFYSYYKTAIGILRASHTGNAGDLFRSIENKTPFIINDFTYGILNPKQDVQHQIAKLSFNYYFNENALLAVQYTFQSNQRLEYDVRRGKFNDRPALNLDLTTNALNIDFKNHKHDWYFKTGINALKQSNAVNTNTGVRPLIPDYDKIDFGAYGIISYNVSDYFLIDGGLRYDFSQIDATKFYLKGTWESKGYNANFSDIIVDEFPTQLLTKPSFRFHNVSANVGFHYKMKNRWDWYTNLSIASRNPNPSEFFSDGLHHSLGIIENGNLNLNKEQSTKLALTFEKKINQFTISTNPYLHYIKDYIFIIPAGFENTIRGTFPVWDYKQTDARILGVDLQTNWDINNQWKHLFGLAYIYGQDIKKNEPLIDMPPVTMMNKIMYSKKNWHNLLLQLSHQLVQKPNRFPNNNFKTDIIENGERKEVLVDISTPPPGYQLLDFYSEMKFKMFKNTQTTIGFAIQNILNVSYRDYLNRQRFFADEIGRSFQLQLKFNY